MEIAAALIIACSNLIQPGHNRSSDEFVIQIKKGCIRRVVKCIEEKTTKYINQQLKCADKVY